MSKADAARVDERVLFIAPSGRDAPLIDQVVRQAGISTEACAGIEDLRRYLSEGAGAALITEEALSPESTQTLVDLLREEPPWSDLPVVVLTSGGDGASPSLLLKTLCEVGNVTLIERPTRIITLVTALQAALRARRRQYEVRDHLIEQDRAQEERSRLLEEAKNANRIKDEFLSTMSHELRTPMTAILGWAHLLRTKPFSEESAGHGLQIIERNARAQTKLIDDLLDISRIMTGKLRLDVQVLDLAAVIEAAVEATRPTAEARSIRLQILIDPQAGPVAGDLERLQQVIWNLLTNAIKFTPRDGRVQVRIERVDSHVEITVTDTGIGISPAFLPHVFDRFQQADGTTTRAHGGLGLGLSIVRQLVEMHGGTVHAESEGEGKGSTFTVQLPLMATRRDLAGPDRRHPTVGGTISLESPPSLAGLRILVVDDEPDTCDMLREVLEQCGSEVTTTVSTRDALVAIEQARPDVLISDLGMPEEDGYSLISKVRAMEAGTGERIPAIALSAYARVEDRVRALSAGFHVHVPKPVEPVELLAVVASLAGRT